MNITIISHNYFPEDSGIGLYTTGMAEFLAKEHQVSIITGVPYYPQWKIYSNYSDSSLFVNEIINGVNVYRFKQYTPQKPTFFSRVLQMGHFFFGSLINCFKIKKTDAVIVVMPFTLSIVLGWILKLLRGGILWVHIQDFEFDAALSVKSSSKIKFVSKILFKIEKIILQKADFVSTISKSMLQKLAEKRIVSQLYFPNWIDHSKIDPSKAIKSELFNSNTFNVLYSGNIGEKQDWEFYVKLVKSMQSHPEIHFYLIGEGAKKVSVVEDLKDCSNFSYYPPVPYNELNNVLCNTDVHVLFQKPEFMDVVMPSKILGMMASAKPSIVTGHEDSEIKVNFTNSGGGCYFDENNLDTIKNNILYLKNQTDISQIMGNKARDFVIEHFSHENVLSQFQTELECRVCEKII
jgi:colanic acid biosynthesis glycosyl transferase WcaI